MVDDCCSEVQSIRFLESTGMKKVCGHCDKISVVRAVIYGPTVSQDVTTELKEYNVQIGCPLECFYVDTGALNAYPGGDIAFGYRKAIEIEYIYETDHKCDDKCDDKCHDKCHDKCKDKCEYKCHDECDDKCYDKCEYKCHDECDDKCYDKCDDKMKRKRRKRNRRHKHCICHNNHYKPCKVKMSPMLYIPLYPIARPYLCPNPKPCHCVNKCNC